MMEDIRFQEPQAGVHSIYEFHLTLPDLSEAERFLVSFGLRVQRDSDQLLVKAAASDHLWVRLSEGDSRRLEYVSLGCYEPDLEVIRRQVIRAGGREVPAHPAGSAGGFWFTDPDGVLLQVKPAAKTMPDEKSVIAGLNVGSNVRGAAARSAARRVAPARLSHLALFTPDINRAVAFYVGGLGLRVSDRSGDIIAFTCGRHGSDHHLLAFLGNPKVGLHHSSWDVPGVEEVGLGNTQMRAAGYSHHWGPGRHVLGSNYFNYVRDSFGLWWEYSAHIDYVEKGAAWEVANFADEDALYLWGPDMPEDFPLNTEGVKVSAEAV